MIDTSRGCARSVTQYNAVTSDKIKNQAVGTRPFQNAIKTYLYVLRITYIVFVSIECHCIQANRKATDTIKTNKNELPIECNVQSVGFYRGSKSC